MTGQLDLLYFRIPLTKNGNWAVITTGNVVSALRMHMDSTAPTDEIVDGAVLKSLNSRFGRKDSDNYRLLEGLEAIVDIF